MIKQLLSSNAKADAGKCQGSAKLELKHVAAVRSHLPPNCVLPPLTTAQLLLRLQSKALQIIKMANNYISSPPKRNFFGQAEKLNQLTLPYECQQQPGEELPRDR